MPKKIIKLKEPLLMETGTDEEPGLRILPVGTILYQGDEGNAYTAFFDHSGWLDFDRVEDAGNEKPIRLRRVTKDELLRRSRQFPLTKDDLAAVIRAGGLTRDDMADIIRSMPS